MQTIRITITSEKPANVVLAERKPEENKDKKKRSSRKKLEDLLSQVLNKAIPVGAREVEKPSCN